MAPFDLGSLGSWAPGLTALLLGAGMGFALERGGLGRAPLLAAQFYLTDMRVLKTMFTAIVTAMVLVLIASGMGWLDDTALWINPTHLWPGILGGVLLGAGFIIGGYCPGTSLVAIATGKLDGLMFAVGILLGTALFGETIGTYWSSWHHWGDHGVLTLHDWMGIPKHWLVLGIILMALSWFVGAEWLERWRGELPAPTARARRWKAAGALALLGLAGVGVGVGQPGLEERIALHNPALQERLDSRAVHMSPDELLELMHNRRLELHIVDVRDDAAFNRFHLLGAERLPERDGLVAWAGSLQPSAVVVLTGDGESEAERAWRALSVSGVSNAYLLEGGLDTWLARFAESGQGPGSGPPQQALGDRHQAARPDPHRVELEPYEPKLAIQQAGGGGGGCG